MELVSGAAQEAGKDPVPVSGSDPVRVTGKFMIARETAAVMEAGSVQVFKRKWAQG